LWQKCSAKEDPGHDGILDFWGDSWFSSGGITLFGNEELCSVEASAMAVISEVTEDGSTLTIRISGRFDFSSHQDFRKAYESIAEPNGGYVIDMSGAEYLDSSALGMLLLMREHAGGDQAQITISNCRPQIKNILKVANFAKLFKVE